MGQRVIALIAIMGVVTGCSPASAVLHGYHRYKDPSAAMEPTIHIGQTINARQVGHGTYRPKRGDVVLFKMPSWGPGADALYVKRVVAIAGDKIACCSSGKQILLNDAPLSEPYLRPGTEEATFGPITVPPDRLWLMGDNRPISADSRMHVTDADHGTVPTASVVGVAVLK